MQLVLEVVLLVLGLFLLVKGSDWFVEGASGIAERFGVPQLVIGLTIVAMGTSAPEAAVSITAALKGNAGITIGNVVGSNIFNILFVIGTTALITPVQFESKFLIDTLISFVAGALLWISVCKTRKLRRPWGIVMLLSYVGYFVYLING